MTTLGAVAIVTIGRGVPEAKSTDPREKFIFVCVFRNVLLLVDYVVGGACFTRANTIQIYVDFSLSAWASPYSRHSRACFGFVAALYRNVGFEFVSIFSLSDRIGDFCRFLSAG